MLGRSAQLEKQKTGKTGKSIQETGIDIQPKEEIT